MGGFDDRFSSHRSVPRRILHLRKPARSIPDFLFGGGGKNQEIDMRAMTVTWVINAFVEATAFSRPACGKVLDFR